MAANTANTTNYTLEELNEICEWKGGNGFGYGKKSVTLRCTGRKVGNLLDFKKDRNAIFGISKRTDKNDEVGIPSLPRAIPKAYSTLWNGARRWVKSLSKPTLDRRRIMTQLNKMYDCRMNQMCRNIEFTEEFGKNPFVFIMIAILDGADFSLLSGARKAKDSAAMKKNIKDLTDAVESLRESVESTDNKIQDLKALTLVRFVNMCAWVEKTQKELQTQIDELAARVDKVEGRVDKVESDVKKVGGDVKKVDDRVKKVETNQGTQDTRMTKMEAQIDKLTKQMEDCGIAPAPDAGSKAPKVNFDDATNQSLVFDIDAPPGAVGQGTNGPWMDNLLQVQTVLEQKTMKMLTFGLTKTKKGSHVGVLVGHKIVEIVDDSERYLKNKTALYGENTVTLTGKVTKAKTYKKGQLRKLPKKPKGFDKYEARRLAWMADKDGAEEFEFQKVMDDYNDEVTDVLSHNNYHQVTSRFENPILLVSYCKIIAGKLSATVLDFRKINFRKIVSGPVPSDTFWGEGEPVVFDDFTPFGKNVHGSSIQVRLLKDNGEPGEWMPAIVLGTVEKA